MPFARLVPACFVAYAMPNIAYPIALCTDHELMNLIPKLVTRDPNLDFCWIFNTLILLVPDLWLSILLDVMKVMKKLHLFAG